MILPFNDPDTAQGFYINSANLSIIGTVGILGNVGIELMNLVMVNNLQSSVAVVSYHLSKLDRMLQTNKEYTFKNDFRNILMMIQDLDAYVILVFLFI